MTDVQRAVMLQSVLEFLQHNAGTPFAVADIAERLECSPGLAETTLEALAEAGQIERLQQIHRPVTYVVNKYL